MITTILLESDPVKLDLLRAKIEACCSFLQVIGTAQTPEGARDLINSNHPDLAFVNPTMACADIFKIRDATLGIGTEFIFVSNTADHTLQAILYSAVGYLFRPLQEEDLKTTVDRARDRIQAKAEIRKNRQMVDKLLAEKKLNESIGIPTLEGYAFIKIREIIRCEGHQKCTRVVTTAQTDILSSYNIGQFTRLLEPYGFFSPHKSHLINLSFISKYLREGTIVLHDTTCIPVSKRKKTEFLDLVIHL